MYPGLHTTLNLYVSTIQYNLSKTEVCLHQKILLIPRMQSENKCKAIWNQKKQKNNEYRDGIVKQGFNEKTALENLVPYNFVSCCAL
jgi:hypothetical protein